MINSIPVTPYKGPTGQEIGSEANVKDVGIINEKIEFKEPPPFFLGGESTLIRQYYQAK